MLACFVFCHHPYWQTTQNGRIPIIFYEQIHKIVQYLSVFHTFETWIKHYCKEFLHVYVTTIMIFHTILSHVLKQEFGSICFLYLTEENYPTSWLYSFWSLSGQCFKQTFSHIHDLCRFHFNQYNNPSHTRN